MRVLGYFVGVIMAIGAVFAAIDTMYASVEVRSVEIATLRALGFEATPIVMSVLLECVVLCATGALIGAGIAFVAFNGFTASTVGGGGHARRVPVQHRSRSARASDRVGLRHRPRRRTDARAARRAHADRRGAARDIGRAMRAG
jgi:hypothetical protein